MGGTPAAKAEFRQKTPSGTHGARQASDLQNALHGGAAGAQALVEAVAQLVAGERLRTLAERAAAAVGIDALFTEVHPHPDQALSDGPNSLDFAAIRELLIKVKKIYDIG